MQTYKACCFAWVALCSQFDPRPGNKPFSLSAIFMTNSVTPFYFDESAVRVLTGHDGEPWFVAKDVAVVLGYSNPQKAVRDHCKAAIPVGVNESFTLDPQTVIIPERDVYRLIMRSKLPSAERFEEWVVGEVLPSIRKTGQYIKPAQPEPQRVPTPLETEQQLQALKRIMSDEDLKTTAPVVWQHLSDAVQNQALAFLGVNQKCLPSGQPLLDVVEIAKRHDIHLPHALRSAAGRYVANRLQGQTVERLVNGSLRRCKAYSDHEAVAELVYDYLSNRAG